jgi:DNA-directed RNA polymerase specialized sigma24 family protein
MTYQEIKQKGISAGQDSGKTIVDIIISEHYEYFKMKAISICKKDKVRASDLLQDALCEFYKYQNLNKLADKLTSEFDLRNYIVRIINITFYSQKSHYNRTYKQVNELLGENEIEFLENLEAIDDFQFIKQQKELYELKYECLFNGLNNIVVENEMKRIFFKYLFSEIVEKGKTCRRVAKELDVPKDSIYKDWKELSNKINEYYKLKCKNL